MLPRNFQSRYRRHLFDFKPLFQLPLARRSLNQLSRFTIHLVQEFHIRSIQSRKNMCETNIVVTSRSYPTKNHLFSPLRRPSSSFVVFSLTLSSSLNSLLVRINDTMCLYTTCDCFSQERRKTERKIKFRVLYPNTKHPFPRGTKRQSKTPLY